MDSLLGYASFASGEGAGQPRLGEAIVAASLIALFRAGDESSNDETSAINDETSTVNDDETSTASVDKTAGASVDEIAAAIYRASGSRCREP